MQHTVDSIQDTGKALIPNALRKYVYYEEPNTVILHGDCLEMLPHFEPKSIDLVLTDPPWNLDYFENDKMIWGNYAVWLKKRIDVYEEKAACTFIFQSTKAVPHVAHIFKGWTMFANPKSFCQLIKGQMCNAFDVGFLNDNKTNFTGESGWRNWHLANNSSAQNAYRGHGHPTPRPLDTTKYIIAMFGHEIILDPFLGSGTTAVAAKQLGRKCIGIEIEEKYCKIAVERLRQEVLL